MPLPVILPVLFLSPGGQSESPNSRMLLSSSFKSSRACSSKTRLIFHQSFPWENVLRLLSVNLTIIHSLGSFANGSDLFFIPHASGSYQSSAFSVCEKASRLFTSESLLSFCSPICYNVLWLKKLIVCSANIILSHGMLPSRRVVAILALKALRCQAKPSALLPGRPVKCSPRKKYRPHGGPIE